MLPGPAEYVGEAFKHRSMRVEIDELQSEIGSLKHGDQESDDDDYISVDSVDIEIDNLKDRIKELQRYEGTGPDGTGWDSNITNAMDLKLAIITICSCWTSRIRTLRWTTPAIPLFSELISHLQSLSTLEEPELDVSACDEDYFIQGNPPSESIHPPGELLFRWSVKVIS